MIALYTASDSAWHKSIEALSLFPTDKSQEDYFRDLESRAQRFAQSLGWRSDKAPASSHGVNTQFTPSGSYQSVRALVSGMRRNTEIPMPALTRYKEDRRS